MGEWIQRIWLVYDDKENEKVVFIFYGGTSNASRIVSYKSVINQKFQNYVMTSGI